MRMVYRTPTFTRIERERDPLEQRVLDELRHDVRWRQDLFKYARKPALLGPVHDVSCLNKDPAQTDSCDPMPGVLVKGAHKGKWQEEFFERGAVHNMAIKYPKTNFRIPTPIWNSYGRVLSQMIELERGLNPFLDREYVWLRVDKREVKAGSCVGYGATRWYLDMARSFQSKGRTLNHRMTVSNNLPLQIFTGIPTPEKVEDWKSRWNYQDFELGPSPGDIYTPPENVIHLFNEFSFLRLPSPEKDVYHTRITLYVSSCRHGQLTTENGLFKDQYKKGMKFCQGCGS